MKKLYIYNPEQAKFYINNGVRVINTGIHYKTKMTFWVFNYNEAQPAFIKWCNRSH